MAFSKTPSPVFDSRVSGIDLTFALAAELKRGARSAGAVVGGRAEDVLLLLLSEGVASMLRALLKPEIAGGALFVDGIGLAL